MVSTNPFSSKSQQTPGLTPARGQSLGDLAKTAVVGGVDAVRRGCAAAGAAASAAGEAANRVAEHRGVQMVASGVASFALGFAKGIVGQGAGADTKSDKGELGPIELNSGAGKDKTSAAEPTKDNPAPGGNPSKKKEEEVGSGSQPT